jgi:hypothetical protein
MKKKNLNIVMSRQRKKTKTFRVSSNHDGSDIGVIYWSGRLRQYVYDPESSGMIWTHEYLLELSDFLRDLNYIQRIRR